MNRRDFIKTLAGLMALPLMKPEVQKPDYSPSLEAIKAFGKTPSGFLEGIKIGLEASGDALLRQTESVVEAMVEQVDTTVYFTPYPEEGLAVWNGTTWATFNKSIEFGAEGELYIKGGFLLESPEEIRRRHLEYYKSHDPNS